MAWKDKLLVRLSVAPRSPLEPRIAAGRHAAAARVPARVRLEGDVGPDRPGGSDDAIAEALAGSAGTVARVRKRFAQGGLEAAVPRKKPTGRPYRKLDGAREAKLVASACAAPPEGKGRGTPKRRADRRVERAVGEAVSDETVGRVLQKTCGSRGSSRRGCGPRRPAPSSWARGRACGRGTPSRPTRGGRW